MQQIGALLKTIVGDQKTLVITCREDQVDCGEDFREQVFTYCPTGVAPVHDECLPQECIRYFVEKRNCTRILVVSTLSPEFPDKESDVPPVKWMSLKTRSQRSVRKMWTNHSTFDGRMTHEWKIIQQGKRILEYDFIRLGLQQKSIVVSGILIRPDNSFHELFRNGIIYNSILTSN